MKKLLCLVLVGMSLFANKTNKECLNMDYKTCYEINDKNLEIKCDNKDYHACFLLTLIELDNNCNKNDYESCHKLANEYESDWKFKKAIELHTKACNGGYFQSCDFLGFFYEHARGVKRDIAKAIHFYKIACDNKGYLACESIGYIYSEGFWLMQNHKKAIEYYKKACEYNKGRCEKLAWQYEKIDDFKNAIKAYEISCDAKNNNACLRLGIMYENGENIEQDINMAKKYYSLTCRYKGGITCDKLEMLNQQEIIK
ncbi:sel1 repeat family protein [Campylobacter sp. RM12642]|uniref:tetratricopeptide repeat protein n=1 Tax=Campylobacter sp. RM12642 TaxID=2735736 RepID=UPI0030156601|nr:sel1 repeat family protein [Campylobacter sp. RM12642]